MIHLLFDKRPWFAPKRFGYGAGLPITWQGWVLLLSYIGLLAGIGTSISHGEAGLRSASIATLVVATAIFSVIVRRRTAGGWRWRWGERD